MYTQHNMIPHIVKKKKRFGLKLREKTITGKGQKEKYKFLAVVVFFLISGILYSHSFYGGSLDMGEEITAEQIGVVEETTIPAENAMGKIDVNSATGMELETLSGIGSSRAADIIKYREENGNFSRIEDLMKVSGIGEKTFEEIKEQITVGE
ncbi:MAG: helix-hairpin-helix domain-containing protein [Anaerotignum sp.]|nr:helix-hairpin-helix domain-containing protein [Anaerotignum sp.]